MLKDVCDVEGVQELEGLCEVEQEDFPLVLAEVLEPQCVLACRVHQGVDT